jgi:hypothetical protein
MAKKTKPPFYYEGDDKNGDPTFRDKNGKKVKENKKPPPLSVDNLIFEVYSWNPT